jgi:hypothetical protein
MPRAEATKSALICGAGSGLYSGVAPHFHKTPFGRSLQVREQARQDAS